MGFLKCFTFLICDRSLLPKVKCCRLRHEKNASPVVEDLSDIWMRHLGSYRTSCQWVCFLHFKERSFVFQWRWIYYFESLWNISTDIHVYMAAIDCKRHFTFGKVLHYDGSHSPAGSREDPFSLITRRGRAAHIENATSHYRRWKELPKWNQSLPTGTVLCKQRANQKLSFTERQLVQTCRRLTGYKTVRIKKYPRMVGKVKLFTEYLYIILCNFIYAACCVEATTRNLMHMFELRWRKKKTAAWSHDKSLCIPHELASVGKPRGTTWYSGWLSIYREVRLILAAVMVEWERNYIWNPHE